MHLTTPLMITESAKGVRAHRATCRRFRNGIRPQDVPESSMLAAATPASCCKPSNVAELTAESDPVLPEFAEPETVKMSDIVAQVSEQFVANAAPVTVLTFLDWSQPQHLWASLGRDAGTAVAVAAGATVVADNTAYTLTLTGPSAAASAVEQLWIDSRAAFKAWKVSYLNTTYEPGDRWSTSAYNEIQDFYRRLGAERAASLR